MHRASTAAVCLLLSLLLFGSVSSAVTLEDKVKEFTLDNGMEFIVVERPDAPVFFGIVGFGVGAIYERPGNTGISHLLEHMLFKGTETIGTKDYEAEIGYLEGEDRLAEAVATLKKEINPWRLDYFESYATKLASGMSDDEREEVGSDKALELGLVIDKLTSDGLPDSLTAVPTLAEDGETDFLDLFVELKENEKRLLKTMAEHRELIVNNELWETYRPNAARFLNAGTSNDGTFYICYLPKNRLELWMLMESDRMANPVFREFYSEREVVMEERRMSENDPEDALYESFMATAYTASQYGVPVLGWMSDLEFIMRDDLEQYYRSYYAPNNSKALLVGDVDVDEVRRLAERYFGGIPEGVPLPELTTREPEQQGERRVVIKKDSKPTLMIGYHIPAAPHPDSYAIDVLSSVLARGRTSRFYKRIYEEQGLTREAPGVWTGPGERLDPLFIIEADPKEPHTLEDVERAIYEELERVKTEPIDMREIERVWNADEAELVRALGSNVGLAFRVGMYEAMRGDWRALLEDMERVKQVTPDDVMRVANKYFTESNRTVGWLVETVKEGEGEAEEEMDFATLMGWLRTLPEEEQRDVMMRFQSADEKGREALGQELWQRMKEENGM